MNGLIYGVRMLALICSPLVGSVFYIVGGFPAPYLLSGALFILLFLVLLIAMTYILPPELMPEADESQSGAVEVLRVWLAWPAFLLMGVIGMVNVSYDPILQPVLAQPEYGSLDVIQVGLVAMIGQGGMGAGLVFVATWLFLVVGVHAQQLLGVVLVIVGLLLYGPVDALDSLLSPSVGLIAAASSLIGLGGALVVLIQPVVLLVIMWNAKRRTKRDLAGGLAAIILIAQNLTCTIGPILGAAIYDAYDLPTVSLVFTLIVACVAIPAVVILCVYAPKPLARPPGTFFL